MTDEERVEAMEQWFDGQPDADELLAAAQTHDDAKRPGLSLHELRHIVALYDLGWTATAERQLRELLQAAEANV